MPHFFSLYSFFLLSIFALLLHLSAIVLRLFLSLLFFSFLSNFPFPLLSSSIYVYFRIFPPSLLSLIFIFLSSTQFIVFSLPPERLQLFGEFVILAGFIYIRDHYFSLEYIFSLAPALYIHRHCCQQVENFAKKKTGRRYFGCLFCRFKN